MHIRKRPETLCGLQTLSLSALSVSIAGWGLNFVEPRRGHRLLSAAMNLVALLSSRVAGCFLAHAHFGSTYVAYVVDVMQISSGGLVVLLVFWRRNTVKAYYDWEGS